MRTTIHTIIAFCVIYILCFTALHANFSPVRAQKQLDQTNIEIAPHTEVESINASILSNISKSGQLECKNYAKNSNFESHTDDWYYEPTDNATGYYSADTLRPTTFLLTNDISSSPSNYVYSKLTQTIEVPSNAESVQIKLMTRGALARGVNVIGALLDDTVSVSIHDGNSGETFYTETLNYFLTDTWISFSVTPNESYAGQNIFFQIFLYTRAPFGSGASYVFLDDVVFNVCTRATPTPIATKISTATPSPTRVLTPIPPSPTSAPTLTDMPTATSTLMPNPTATSAQFEFNCLTVDEIPQKECEALVGIYTTTGGASWTISAGWLQNTTPCSWYGVTCSSGNVVALDLYKNEDEGINLSGGLPSDIGNLSKLTKLNLGDNQLNTLPTTIGMLTDLTLMELSGNRLSSVPAEIGNLTNLITLDLSFNQLSSIPAKIGNLSNLEELYIWHNQLSNIPREIGNLTNLTTLHLDSNQLGSIPAEIGNLTNLTSLDLASNKLHNLPAEIGNLVDLDTLLLDFNQLVSLPAEFIKLENLFFLTISENHLTDVSNELRIFLDEKTGDDWADSQTLSSQTGTNTPVNTNTPILPTNTPSSTNIPVNTNTPILPTNTPSSTNTPTIVPTLPPSSGSSDRYEPDNECNMARFIDTNGLPQTHTFHVSADKDWVAFSATQGSSYRIEVDIPIGSPADIGMEIHKECGGLPSAQFHPSFAPNISAEFESPQNGPIYLRLANHDSTVAGADVTYEIKVRLLPNEPNRGKAIILAGRLKGNDGLQSNINNATTIFYNALQANGYTNDDIFFLSTDSTMKEYDALASKENLRLAITEWAKERVGKESALTMYLMDHGNQEIFYIDDLAGERLAPEELDSWLDELQAAVPGFKINIIIEACYSGSFIEGPTSISGNNRVIITSTDHTQIAFASREGAIFSDQFITRIRGGFDLFSSFSHARDQVTKLYTIQQPMIDADGDAIANEVDDFALAAQRGFAYAGSLSDEEYPPFIANVQEKTMAIHRQNNNFTRIIEAEVRDDNSVDDVWATIYPPSYEAPTSSEELVLGPEEILFLQRTGEDDHYAVTYSGFTETGTYTIHLHAIDKKGLTAAPVVLEIDNGVLDDVEGLSTNVIYLPIISQ